MPSVSSWSFSTALHSRMAWRWRPSADAVAASAHSMRPVIGGLCDSSSGGHRAFTAFGLHGLSFTPRTTGHKPCKAGSLRRCGVAGDGA